jgi:hypothetical protein
MTTINSGIGLMATAAWWSLSGSGVERALDASGLLTDEARVGFDELDTVASQGLRLGVELARVELIGSFIDRMG